MKLSVLKYSFEFIKQQENKEFLCIDVCDDLELSSEFSVVIRSKDATLTMYLNENQTLSLLAYHNRAGTVHRPVHLGPAQIVWWSADQIEEVLFVDIYKGHLFRYHFLPTS